MRNPQLKWNTRHQRVIRHSCTLKNSEALLVKRSAADAIDMENGGMRRQAGPDCRSSVVFGPIDNFGESAPIRLVRQREGTRLRSSHNQAIEAAGPQIVNVGIAAAQMRPPEFGSRHVRQ